MDQYGFLIINLIAIKLYHDGRVMEQPMQVSKVHERRDDAMQMMKEHKRQVSLNQPGIQYIYDWQPEREDWTNKAL